MTDFAVSNPEAKQRDLTGGEPHAQIERPRNTHISESLAGDVEAEHVSVDAASVHRVLVHARMLGARGAQQCDPLLRRGATVLHRSVHQICPNKLPVAPEISFSRFLSGHYW